MELIDFSNCFDDVELFDGKAGAKKVLFIMGKNGY